MRFIPWNSQPLADWAERHAKGKFIDLAGKRTHYLTRGRGKPVVLIHGFNLDSQTWAKNIDPLATRFKVYAPDLWGQGFSTRQPLDFGYDLFAEQIRLFLEALDVEKASLVGHSMGGGTSIVFAHKHREIIDKLVLLGTAGIPSPLPFRSKLFRLRGVAEFLMSLPTDRIRRMNLENLWLYDRDALTEEQYQNFVRCQKIEGTTEVLLTILRKNFFHTLQAEIEKLGDLDIPVLIVWGRDDATVSVECAEQIHRLLHGSQLEILERAAHLANFDRPDAFNELVLEFLSD
jgi:pimeloyl-ACP methyl ester carboxylesterase